MGLALKITGDRSLAEEVVQETFWRVWRKADLFQTQRGAFTSWFFGITRNLSIDVLRRQRTQIQPVEETDAERIIEQAVDPSMNVPEAAWLREKHQQMQAAIGSPLRDCSRRRRTTCRYGISIYCFRQIVFEHDEYFPLVAVLFLLHFDYCFMFRDQFGRLSSIYACAHMRRSIRRNEKYVKTYMSCRYDLLSLGNRRSCDCLAICFE